MQGESGRGGGEILGNCGEEGDDGAEVRSYKILVLGNSGAGKTSLVRRSVRDYFSRDYRLAPIKIPYTLGRRSGYGASKKDDFHRKHLFA